MTGYKPDGHLSAVSVIARRWQFLVPLVRNKQLKVSDECCNVMKKDPLNAYLASSGKYPITGVTAAEGKNRELSWKMYGCNAYDLKHPASRPLMAWSEQDILHYLKDNQIPIATAYGDLVENDRGELRTTKADRTGCMFCCFGAHREARPNRFQRMKATHPAQWRYIIDKLGAREVLDLLHIPYEPDDPHDTLDLFQALPEGDSEIDDLPPLQPGEEDLPEGAP